MKKSEEIVTCNFDANRANMHDEKVRELQNILNEVNPYIRSLKYGLELMEGSPDIWLYANSWTG